MAYIDDFWAELLVEIKAEFTDVNAIMRYHQIARKNWGDILKIAEEGGAEQRLPWIIVAFGRQVHSDQAAITSVAKLLPVSIIYVCKYDAVQNIDLFVETKMRGIHDRLVDATKVQWQFPLDGNTGNIDFQATDETGMALMIRQEPVFSGTYSFEALVGEIAPVND